MKGKGFFIAEVYERDICHFSLLKDQNEITATFVRRYIISGFFIVKRCCIELRFCRFLQA